MRKLAALTLVGLLALNGCTKKPQPTSIEIRAVPLSVTHTNSGVDPAGYHGNISSFLNVDGNPILATGTTTNPIDLTSAVALIQNEISDIDSTLFDAQMWFYGYYEGTSRHAYYLGEGKTARYFHLKRIVTNEDFDVYFDE